MLAMFILNISPNVSFSTLKSNTIGLSNPNCCSYESHQSHDTPDANFPSNPPITNPANKNTNNIHIFFSLVAISLPPFFSFVLTDTPFSNTLILYIDFAFFSSGFAKMII